MWPRAKFNKNFKFRFVKFWKQIAPFESISREVPFKWSHHWILSADSKVRTTLRDSNIYSGSKRVKSIFTNMIVTHRGFEPYQLFRVLNRLGCGILTEHRLAFLVLPLFFTELNRETATNILEAEFKRNVNAIVFLTHCFIRFQNTFKARFHHYFIVYQEKSFRARTLQVNWQLF